MLVYALSEASQRNRRLKNGIRKISSGTEFLPEGSSLFGQAGDPLPAFICFALKFFDSELYLNRSEFYSENVTV